MDGDPNKVTNFKEVVGGLQDFRVFLFMKPGSAYVTVMHSPMKFFAISDATQHLQGRYIGFIGDRTTTKDPTAIVLPQQKTWTWESKVVTTDAASLAAHYADDTNRLGTLWASEAVIWLIWGIEVVFSTIFFVFLYFSVEQIVFNFGSSS